MKARIIDTCFYNKTRLAVGEIVEIVPNMETDAEGIWNAPAGKLFLCKKQDGTFAYSLPQDLQFLSEEMSDTDWSEFRREAAKDILAGILSNPNDIEESGKPIRSIEGLVDAAVTITDLLIERLKNGTR
jgi:hypothetical protein